MIDRRTAYQALQHRLAAQRQMRAQPVRPVAVMTVAELRELMRRKGWRLAPGGQWVPARKLCMGVGGQQRLLVRR